MRIVFWGSSDFSLPSLKQLAKHQWIVGVVTNPDKPYGRGMHQKHQTPIKIWASSQGIICLQPETLRDETFRHNLESLQADLFVVVSYGYILPKDILCIPFQGAINLHASLLPRYRGASPIHAAILNGDSYTGNTIQYMSEALDAGDIILQSKLPIDPHDTYSTLANKLAEEGAFLLEEAIQKIIQGTVSRIPQNHLQASYSHLIRKEDGFISFENLTAEEIIRRYRAYHVWPGIFTTYQQNKHPVTIHLLQIDLVDTSGKAGTILRADKTGLVIACKKQALHLEKLKPAGRKEMDFMAFINGYKPQVGKVF